MESKKKFPHKLITFKNLWIEKTTETTTPEIVYKPRIEKARYAINK